jgi:hypothetical protein
MASKIRIVLYCLLLISVQQCFAQEGSKSKKKLEEKKEAKEKSSAKVIQEGENFHMKIQTKETRKRMKESRKKADMLNANAREPFYKRWFRKKHH